jgi:hypothetical protein
VSKCARCGKQTEWGIQHCDECWHALQHGTEPGSAAQLDAVREEKRDSSLNRSGGGGGAAIVAGLLVGALLGYPLSYYFQPSALRSKVSLGQYIEHVGEVVGNSELVSAVYIGFAVAMSAGAGIAWLVQTSRQSTK